MLYCPGASEARPAQQPGVAHPGPATLSVCPISVRPIATFNAMFFLFPALALYTIYICTICAHAVLNLATNDSLINCHTVMRFKLSCLYSTVRRLSPVVAPTPHLCCLLPGLPVPSESYYCVWVVVA